ncbi:MAG: flagellar export chaperone FliS [Planctomycetota bacterium]
MNPAANRDYLEQRIKTASSAQLHLMLIEGAIRFAEQATRAYEANDVDAGAQPLLRSMDIVSEMLAGVKHSRDEVNVKLASLYQFIFTRLTMAYVNNDLEKLGEAVGVLHFERDTWRQACEKAAAEDTGAETSAKPDATPELKGPHTPSALAPTPAPDLAAGGGLSIEA